MATQHRCTVEDADEEDCAKCSCPAGVCFITKNEEELVELVRKSIEADSVWGATYADIDPEDITALATYIGLHAMLGVEINVANEVYMRFDLQRELDRLEDD